MYFVRLPGQYRNKRPCTQSLESRSPQTRTPSLQRQTTKASLLRRRRFRVIVISQQASDSITCAVKVLDIDIQVFDALLRAPLGYLQLHILEMFPTRLAVMTLSLVTESAVLLRFRPRPCNVHFPEVHISALCTHALRLRIYTKQNILRGLAWNLNEKVLAWLHQVESLTMHILQMWVTRSRRACSCSTEHTTPNSSTRKGVSHDGVEIILS